MNGFNNSGWESLKKISFIFITGQIGVAGDEHAVRLASMNTVENNR
jgi:hypothetical protein